MKSDLEIEQRIRHLSKHKDAWKDDSVRWVAYDSAIRSLEWVLSDDK